ncbi:MULTISPECIES: MerR family transcriptional regulator [Methylobacterium]|nr:MULTISPECIES: helix-turn-helix domain-containing protein [Methylobacterium]MBY0297642.1 helix-turn-helix domain-containing protein [Methylobacterium sp.]MDN3625762.1 helix-turn-helix domain-containing protein [Methylobacterium isbiliense]
MTIGNLAKATGTRVETVRWYEKVGLLPEPERSGGNYRLYGPGHLRRLSFIRRGRALGFTVEQIRDLLALSDDRERSCGEVDTIARAHLADVERKLADLTRLAAELREVIGQCGCGSVADCRIIEALSPSGEAA